MSNYLRSVNIVIGEVGVQLTLMEARQLHDELHRMFSDKGGKPIIVIPPTITWPEGSDPNMTLYGNMVKIRQGGKEMCAGTGWPDDPDVSFKQATELQDGVPCSVSEMAERVAAAEHDG